MQIEQPTTRSWRAIAEYARPHWKTLVTGGVLLTVGGFVGLAQPLIARRIVESLGNDETIRDPIILLIGLIVVGALISAFGSYLLERTAESVVRGARMRLIDKILWLRLPSMERDPTGRPHVPRQLGHHLAATSRHLRLRPGSHPEHLAGRYRHHDGLSRSGAARA